MLREQVVAIRAGAAAIVAQADAILAAIAPSGAPAGPSGMCQHPRESRRAAPRMGHPEAWICERCDTEGEGD